MKKLNYFELVTGIGKKKKNANGVLLVNDLSGKSNFMFDGWALYVMRPKTVDCLRALKQTALGSTGESSCIKELVEFVSGKSKTEMISDQESYFMIVSFDKKMDENFSLLFSKKANFSLLEPIAKNFSASKQSFQISKIYENPLFEELEDANPGISCFELRLRDPFNVSNTSVYPVERVFEETTIFANLAIAKQI